MRYDIVYCKDTLRFWLPLRMLDCLHRALMKSRVTLERTEYRAAFDAIPSRHSLHVHCMSLASRPWESLTERVTSLVHSLGPGDGVRDDG